MRIASCVLLPALTIFLFEGQTSADDKAEQWFHPRTQPLEVSNTGPFAQLKDDTLVTVRDGDALLSRDDGKTWDHHPISSEHKLKASPEIVTFVTRDGTIVIALLNLVQEKWGWDEKENRPIEGVQLPVWTARSTDGGKTWTDVQQIQADWCGAVRSMIQTKDGALVLSSTHLKYPQPYHTSVTYVSTDDGRTWKRGEHIDIGGRGHHDGAVEGCLVELRDGRLWYLLRTNRDAFWQSFSKDGLTWSEPKPIEIDASSSPAMVQRLKSGRLVLVWNRLAAEGQPVTRRDDKNFSERPASWHRRELSIAFSDDDGRSWTKPAVIARSKTGSEFSYPFLLERRPGELWLTTMFGGLKLRLEEKDFAAPAN